MKIIQGNKKLENNKDAVNQLTAQFNKTVLDLGAGDGRFVFKTALNNPNNFYIAVDPSEKSIEEYSKKAVKEKVKNTLFVIGSIEVYPEELTNIANEVYVNLPWGSLLQSIASPTTESVNKIKSIFKTSGNLNITFGYDPELEPNETKRLNLPPIDYDYIQNKVIPTYTQNGFKIKSLKELTSSDLKSMESTWAKKISLRMDRPIFTLVLEN